MTHSNHTEPGDFQNSPGSLPQRRRWLSQGVLVAALFFTGCQTASNWKERAWAWMHQHHGLSVPEVLPLGSVNRAHYHTMQTNAEAADFIMHRHDFVGSTAELTPAARDRILEIAARAPSAPFPVLIERSWNNSNPELDAHRRNIVVQVLHDMGIPEANQRVIVSPAYGKGITSREGEFDYYQTIFSRGANGGGGFGNNGGGNGSGFGGGFGGGGFGGGGFVR